MSHPESRQQSTSLTVEQAFAHAIAHHQSGQLHDAERLYRSILNAHPSHAGSDHNLGVLWTQLAMDAFAERRYVEAEVLAERLVTRPFTHAIGLKVLGTVYGRIGRYEEAVATLSKAAALLPSDADIHNSMGAAFLDSGQLDAAMKSFLRAVELNPEYAESHSNLGFIRNELGQVDAALLSCHRALAIRPDFAEAHCNLGYALKSVGRFSEAIPSFQRALELRPDLHVATLNLGIALLSLGRYAEGWPRYEARSALGDRKMLTAPDLPFPSWCGEPLAGRSIVIIEEQGIGDDLQFFRYASRLKEMGAARVTLVCKNRLGPLFSRMKGIDSVVERGDVATVPSHDFWSFAQSLPLQCGTTVETVPADVPYLFADAALTAQVASEIGTPAGLRIGICWKGSAAYKGDAERSPGIGFFKPIFGIDGVRVYTLLPNSRAELIATAGDKAVDIGHEIDEFTAPFAETAALIMNLDLVITSDTSICHLAGALGKPVWLVLPYAAHWVWMTDREDSPWYPNTRLFRQTERGDWAGVFERVAQKIKAVLAGETPLVWPIE